MLTLILTLSMLNAKPAPQQTAQFQPCVWPNKCVTEPVAQFQPCVWPNRCMEPVAQFETCVYPKKCGGKKA